MSSYAYRYKLIAIIVINLIFAATHAQTSCTNFPNMRQTKHTANISSFVKGYLEYMPADSLTNVPHPLIINFHGAGEAGDGTTNDLCKLLDPTNSFDVVFPKRIEQGTFTPTVTFNAHTYSYIIMSPQYTHYNYPSDYPGAADVEAVINYAVALYGAKINTNKIYLTGMSTGANMIVDYAASSLARSSRIAGLYSVALCIFPPVYGTNNIASANLPYWGVHCINDNSGCDYSFHQNWVNSINSNNPPPNPLAKLTGLPLTGPWACNAHNVWNAAYDPAFTDNGLNVYNWLIQYSRNAALPVKLKYFSVTLEGSKVVAEWVTSSEINTDKFILERAKGNGAYEQIATIPAAGVTSTDKKYSFVDDPGLNGIYLYRLSLNNKDGRKEYLSLKRINIPDQLNENFIVKNPAHGSLKYYIHLSQSEQINMTLLDMSGKQIVSSKKLFAAGTSEGSLDISGYTNGTYLLRIDGENFHSIKKILIN